MHQITDQQIKLSPFFCLWHDDVGKHLLTCKCTGTCGKYLFDIFSAAFHADEKLAKTGQLKVSNFFAQFYFRKIKLKAFAASLFTSGELFEISVSDPKNNVISAER